MTASKQALSYLQPPNRDEVPVEFQATLDTMIAEQEAKQGFSNALLHVLPLNPHEHKGFLDFKNSLFNEEHTYLSIIDKEMIGLVVSSTNMCNYCLTTHSDVLRGLTKDPVWVDRLTYNYRSAKLSLKQLALCEYAFRATKKPDELSTKEVDLLREAGFNDHEILEAAYVVGFFNYTNRWVSTIGAIANPGHHSNNR
ncbi:peroxidase-related enzyme [Solibacillus sp. FSL H8-0538]|uniref:peroxidase-related enzyme n=1 Tax=Solibacillus sp. FSL H8-0538 TaxID=2921400 RepID=UPI0030FC2852